MVEYFVELKDSASHLPKDNNVNILVIDNTPTQLTAAKTQLEALGHTVTCVDNFYGFMALAMENAHSTLRFWEPKIDFDVVMTDLFMPASPKGLATYREEAGRIAKTTRRYFEDISYEDGKIQATPSSNAPEVPYGLVIAMTAAMAGAKKVGVLSLGDHHADPMAWAMDSLEHTPLVWDAPEQRFPRNKEEEVKAGEGAKRFTRTFMVNGATMAFCTGYACPRICTWPDGDPEITKNWAAVLERLMSL